MFVIFLHCLFLIPRVHLHMKSYSKDDFSDWAKIDTTNSINLGQYLSAASSGARSSSSASDSACNFSDEAAEHEGRFVNSYVKDYLKKLRASECIENYPKYNIEQALKRTNLATLIAASVPAYYGTVHAPRVDSQKICNSSRTKIQLPKMRNIKGEEQIIVHTNDYPQEIYADFCDKEDECLMKNSGSYHTSCEQNYYNTSLLVFRDGIIKTDMFEIECGCICVIKYGP